MARGWLSRHAARRPRRRRRSRSVARTGAAHAALSYPPPHTHPPFTAVSLRTRCCSTGRAPRASPRRHHATRSCGWRAGRRAAHPAGSLAHREGGPRPRARPRARAGAPLPDPSTRRAARAIPPGPRAAAGRWQGARDRHFKLRGAPPGAAARGGWHAPRRQPVRGAPAPPRGRAACRVRPRGRRGRRIREPGVRRTAYVSPPLQACRAAGKRHSTLPNVPRCNLPEPRCPMMPYYPVHRAPGWQLCEGWRGRARAGQAARAAQCLFFNVRARACCNQLVKRATDGGARPVAASNCEREQRRAAARRSAGAGARAGQCRGGRRRVAAGGASRSAAARPQTSHCPRSPRCRPSPRCPPRSRSPRRRPARATSLARRTRRAQRALPPGPQRPPKAAPASGAAVGVGDAVDAVDAVWRGYAGLPGGLKNRTAPAGAAAKPRPAIYRGVPRSRGAPRCSQTQQTQT
jgi:hypothetical protein